MNYSILFVCLGNICRSPTAEAVFTRLAQDEELSPLKLQIDSAGTIAHHAGEHSDHRSISAGKKRGYDLSNIISRQVIECDFENFDLLIAMDNSNFTNLSQIAHQTGQSHLIQKIKLFLDYSTQTEYTEVPDPYYGGSNGFDRVIDLVEDASQGLIRQIKNI